MSDFIGFAIQKNDSVSPEACAIVLESHVQDFKTMFVQSWRDVPHEGWVPCGSVEWVQSFMVHHLTPHHYPDFTPNYYPKFLEPYLYRKVWKTNKWPLDERVFIKPADRYKKFTGFVKRKGSYKGKKPGPYWCSEVVKFYDEWRYYISNGEVLAAEWYAGENEVLGEEHESPPLPNIKFPKGWCGALDMGYTGKNQHLTLIEAQHPFACGWYGKNHKAYVQWLRDGWEYMKKEIQR